VINPAADTKAQIAPIRNAGEPWIESTQRHQAPDPRASSVENVMKTIWKPLSDI
jgi:hypothetical protein